MIFINNLKKDINNDSCYQSIEQPYKLITIWEIALALLHDKKFSQGDISSSLSRSLKLQKHIPKVLSEVTRAAFISNRPSSWYICDRSGLIL